MKIAIKILRNFVYDAAESLRVVDTTFLTSFQKDLLQTLQKELPLLKTFQWYSEKLSGLYTTKTVEAEDCLADVLLELDALDKDCENDLEVIEMFLQKLQQLHPVLKQALLDLSDLSMGGQYFTRDDCKELLDIAVENLKYLLVRKFHIIAPVKKQIGAVQKRLEFVSSIFHFASRDQHIDQFYSFCNHIKDWANSAAAVTFLYWVDELDEKVNAMVSNLIEKFKPRTIELAELYLGALKALNPSQELDFYLKGIAVARFLEILLEDLLLPTDDGFEILQHGLAFFISFLVHPPREGDEEEKLISIQRNFCVNEAASLICSLYASNLKKDMPSRSNSLLHDLIQKINQAEAEIRKLQLEMQAVSWRNFPRTNAQGFLNFFIEDLKEKLKYETCTIYQRHQVMTVQKLLESLNPSLMGVFELQDENEEIKDLQTQISRMAYVAEYFIDCCFFSDPTNYWHNVMYLSDVIEKILFIKTQLNKSRHAQRANKRVFLQMVNPKSPPQANNTGMDDVMVGFTDEKEKIISCLTGGLPQREIVAIVGMPGLGKTTLDKKVYYEPRVRLHFQKYAWRCISQEYKIKDILIDILKQVDQTLYKDDISNKSHEDLAEMLYRCLKGNNYLIVLDDVWDTGAWNYLKASFPNDENGSRIMFTSRIHKVALDAKHDCIILEPHALSPEDSLKLLQQKLSYKDGFPLNLLVIGQKIAENSKGLPLAIVAIAGLLANADGNLIYWEKIAQSLKSRVAKEGCMDILELSYKHLPDYLKSCFLYLAAFREDESILSKRLTQYWIAEGFVQKHEDKSLEDVADEYLMDLVSRSLLIVAKRSSKYGIEKCVVHDLVRELCLEKAKEENFLAVPNISDSHSNIDIMQQSYRLCLHMEGCLPSSELEPVASTVRTLLSPVSVEILEASFFFVCFKFLRMLELECWDKNLQSDVVTQLVALQYLALRGAFHIVPSIANLSRLKHLLLDVKNSIPTTIWNMSSLRYLYLGPSQFYGIDDLVDKSLQLNALESFMSCRECLEDELKWQLRRMPYVRKLSIRLTFCVRLSDFLSKLKSLRLLAYKVKLSVPEFGLPSTLSKLAMNGPILSESVISAIGKLPNLEVFKLLDTKLEHNRWDVKDDEFLNLKYLKLCFSDIEEWNVSTDCFPQLQQLILKDCKYLDEVPSRFGMLPTLKVMNVFRCEKLVNSVDEIVAEQEELGNEDLQVKTKN